MSETKTVKGYMCKIDWDHELGHAMGGNTIYPCIKDLRRCHPMCDECGIVEVEVKLSKVIDHGDIFKNVKNKKG